MITVQQWLSTGLIPAITLEILTFSEAFAYRFCIPMRRCGKFLLLSSENLNPRGEKRIVGFADFARFVLISMLC